MWDTRDEAPVKAAVARTFPHLQQSFSYVAFDGWTLTMLPTIFDDWILPSVRG